MNRRFRGVLPRSRGGFTLVELLVVISIIGMLAALLLPAVNAAREAGRKSVCINNQRQVGLAVFQYETAKNEYPGYVIPQSIDGSTKNASRPVGWVWALLPRMERSDITENYGTNAPAGYATTLDAQTGPFAAPNFFLKILVCPSDARSQTPDPEQIADAASSSYVANCGLKDQETSTITVGTPGSSPTYVDAKAMTGDAAKYPRDWAANGVFHYNFPYYWDSSAGTYVPSGEKVTKSTSSSISDGVSTTLLLSENADGGNWTDAFESEVGFVWQATVDGNGEPAPSKNGAFENLTVALLKINENAGASVGSSASGNAEYQYARPSSYHPGGVVVTYADAHTSFLSSDVDYKVYCLLMSPRGKYTLPAGLNGIDTGNGNTQRLFLGMPSPNQALQIFARSTLDESQL